MLYTSLPETICERLLDHVTDEALSSGYAYIKRHRWHGVLGNLVGEKQIAYLWTVSVCENYPVLAVQNPE